MKIVVEKTIIVEKDNYCRKNQFLLKKTIIVVLDERPYNVLVYSCTWWS